MSDLVEFFTSQEIIVVYFVVIAASVLCFMIYLVEKNNVRARRRHNTRELNKLVKEVREQTVEEEPVETVFYEEPVLLQSVEVEPKESSVEELLQEVNTPEVLEETAPEVVPNNYQVSFDYLEEDTLEDVFDDIEPVVVESAPVVEPVVETMDEVSSNDDELVYTDIEPNQEEAKRQLDELTKKLQEEEQQVEDVIENIELTDYETEQENNAIISLEELVSKSKEMYAANELTQYADEGNEPISIKDLEEKVQMKQDPEYQKPFVIENVVEEKITKEEINEMYDEKLHLDDFNTVKVEPIKEEVKRFKSSPVISPVFGIEKKENTPMMELENTANYDKLDEEIKKTNEFIMTLKDLQKHLD